ncbi:MAG: hypothetical protein LBF84_01025 [Holosporales bacterium]|nr:hypothetical protein [Holosporales bacterium]
MKNSIFRKCALFAFFLLGVSSVFPGCSRVTFVGDPQDQIAKILLQQYRNEPFQEDFTNFSIFLNDNPHFAPKYTAQVLTTSSNHRSILSSFVQNSDVIVIVIHEDNNDKLRTLQTCIDMNQKYARPEADVVVVFQRSKDNPSDEICENFNAQCRERGYTCINMNPAIDQGVDPRTGQGVEDLHKEISKRGIAKIEMYEKLGVVDIAGTPDAEAERVSPNCC